MAAKSRQSSFLKKEPSAYGGILRNTRKGRQGARPLAVRKTIHLVLRSSKATGKMSFRYGRNAKYIQFVVKKFAFKNGVKILSMANVGNHLHLHIKLSNRFGYAPFIRATTGAIALAVMNSDDREPAQRESRSPNDVKQSFWDYRPFTRVIEGLRDYLTVRDYVRINQLEGVGIKRDSASILVKKFQFDLTAINAVP